MLIANTSNMPVMAREASIYTGVTVAEYYRDMGYDAVVIADSTSRWAEALREISSRIGELPAEEGYPPSLAPALAAFYERAGRVTTLGGREGSVTILGAVSPPGGDMTEPVTAHTRRFVRAVWSLDRDLAYARHYPAVSWATRLAETSTHHGRLACDERRPGWRDQRARALGLLAEADRVQAVAELVGAASLPTSERVVLLAGRLLREAVLQQNASAPTTSRGAAPPSSPRCSPWCSRSTTAAIDLIHRGVRPPSSRSSTSRTAARRAMAREPRRSDDAPALEAIRRDALCWRRRRWRPGARSGTTRDCVRGPLVVGGDVAGVGVGRVAEIRLASGEVAAASCSTSPTTLRWCEVFEGTVGSGTRGRGVVLPRLAAAHPGRGTGWLGPGVQRPRRAARRGPADPRRGDRARWPATRSTRGAAGRPREPVLTGVSARSTAWPAPSCGAGAADLLGRRSAASGARRADRRAGAGGPTSPSLSWSSAMGDHPCDVGRRRARALAARGLGGTSPSCFNTAAPARRATRHAPPRADDRRAPGLRGRPPRAGGPWPT